MVPVIYNKLARFLIFFGLNMILLSVLLAIASMLVAGSNVPLILAVIGVPALLIGLIIEWAQRQKGRV